MKGRNMKKFKHILVPVDFSDASGRAFSIAVDLADELGAEVKVIFIYQIQAQYMIDGGLYTPEFDQDEELKKCEKELDEFVKKHIKKDINISKEVRTGVPDTEILQIAGEYQADLIVMGTHGRTGLSHLIMGSVTENVLRHANVPLLSVRQAD